MPTIRLYLVPGLWVAWVIVWWLWSRDVKPVRRRESAASRATHVVPLALAAFLLASRKPPGGLLDGRFLPAGSAAYWSGVALLVLGLAFSVWARAYLGRNWSGVVTLKEDHELIRSGPYRYVRHPIYSGLLLALLGTAIVRGDWLALLAVAIALGALWHKLRLEERWLGEMFGEDYARYQAEVAALIPFVL
jgi:protein-S-isoprenylcysteine O-methyltransferase Ste14